MPTSLVKNLAIDPTIAGIQISVRGLPWKAYKVEVQVVNDSTALPGTKVYPAAPADWLDVTACPTAGRGWYHVGVPAGAVWTPADAMAKGRIRWRIQTTAAQAAKIIDHPIEVLDPSVATSASQVYATIDDCRASLPTSISNAAIHDRILEWRDLFERVAIGQRFRAVLEAKAIDGVGSETAFLPEAVHAILGAAMASHVDLETVLGTIDAIADLRSVYVDAIRVLGSSGIDRANPRVEIIGYPAQYVAGLDWSSIFPEGVPSTIVGVWGWLDPDTADCPKPIRRATVIGTIKSFGYEPRGAAASGGAAGPIRSESTDGHSYDLAFSTLSVRGGLLSILKDPAVRDAISLYRAPIAIATSGSGG